MGQNQGKQQNASAKKRSSSQSHNKHHSSKVVKPFDFDHSKDLLGNQGIKIDNKYRKASDQTAMDLINEKNHSKPCRKSITSRFSVNSVASTAHSDLHQKSSSSNSPDHQISPQEIIEEDNILANSAITNSPNKKVSYYEQMLIRYHCDLKELPVCDQEDFILNPKGISEQVAPEYAHEIYSLMLKQEKSQILGNYLSSSKSASKSSIRECDRDRAALRIMNLCEQKGYKLETLLLAVNILDMVLYKAHGILGRDQLPLLVATICIIAAKMEQPLTPSINRMIKLLEDDEQEYVDKEAVIHMEEEILKLMQFDFNLLSPLTFLERFMKISDYQDDKKVVKVSHELLKLVASSHKFLSFKPSNIGAAILVLAVNFTSHSVQQLKSNQYCLNIWNHDLINISGIKKDEFEEIIRLLIVEAQQSQNFSVKNIQKLISSKLIV